MLIASLFRLISSPIRLIGSSTVVGGRQGIDDVAGVDDVAVKMQASEGTRAVVVGTRVGRGRGVGRGEGDVEGEASVACGLLGGGELSLLLLHSLLRGLQLPRRLLALGVHALRWPKEVVVALDAALSPDAAPDADAARAIKESR
jgi:hypothetical protein